MDDLQAARTAALGVVFVRRGPTEMSDAIADVAGDEPVVARDHVAAEGSIRVQQATQLFWVELFAKRRRADEIAEHDGKLAAFACYNLRLEMSFSVGVGRPGRRLITGGRDFGA